MHSHVLNSFITYSHVVDNLFLFLLFLFLFLIPCLGDVWIVSPRPWETTSVVSSPHGWGFCVPTLGQDHWISLLQIMEVSREICCPSGKRRPSCKPLVPITDVPVPPTLSLPQKTLPANSPPCSPVALTAHPVHRHHSTTVLFSIRN